MPIGNSYPVDSNISDKDLLIGTRSSNLSTVNYAAETVAKYLNQKGKISIGGQLTFKFVDVNPVSGTISLPGGGGDNTPFASITNLIVSIFDVSFQDVVNYLTYIVGSEILLNQQKETSIFGNYKILSYTVTANPNLYDLELQYLGGPGNIAVNNFYDLSFFRAEPAPTDLTLSTIGTTGPATLVGTLLNIPNYTTDLSGYVQTSRTINTTSPLQGGGDLSANRTLSILQANTSQSGFLSSTDWNTFNSKGNGTVTSVSALTLGTAGTDLNSSVTTGTTTPVITLNVPTASAINRGVLSSSDWTAFNSKYTLPALTSGSVLFSNGTTIAQDNANLFWDDTNNRLGIGTNAPTVPLDVNGRVFISTGTEGAFIAPLVVKNTISYQSPFTQFIQIWQNNINQNILTLRTDGSLTLAGSNSTYNSSFFLSNNNGNGTSLLTFARGNNGFWFPSGNSLGINTNGAEKLRVLSTGEVTIGATTAGARLDVRAQGALGTDIAFRVRNSADTTNLIQVAGNGIVTLGVLIVSNLQGLNLYASGEIGSGVVGSILPSAIMEARSTIKGFLPPRMTNAQRLAIASPAIGLMVYCTDTVEGLYINKPTGWQFIV